MSSMQAYASRTGWIMLAAIVMFSVGLFRIISGISYLVDSHKVNDFSLGLFGDNMWLWGIWDLGIGAIAIWAAYSLLGGGEFVAAYTESDAVSAYLQFMASPEFANKRVEQGAAISANKGLDPALATSDLDRQSIELLQSEDTTFRFDGSDLMPGAVGANSFWSGVVEWINGKSTKEVVDSIEASWPSD